MPCSVELEYPLHPEDGGSTDFTNTGILPHYMASQSRWR